MKPPRGIILSTAVRCAPSCKHVSVQLCAMMSSRYEGVHLLLRISVGEVRIQDTSSQAHAHSYYILHLKLHIPKDEHPQPCRQDVLHLACRIASCLQPGHYKDLSPGLRDPLQTQPRNPYTTLPAMTLRVRWVLVGGVQDDEHRTHLSLLLQEES